MRIELSASLCGKPKEMTPHHQRLCPFEIDLEPGDRHDTGRARMARYTMMIDGSDGPRGLYVESGSRYVLGRASDSAFQLPESDRRISRYHAAVEGTLGGIRIQDLGSSNGTFVNGTQVDSAVLRPGDRVRLGKTVLVVGRLDSTPPQSSRRRSTGSPLSGPRQGKPLSTVRDAWTETAMLVCCGCGARWPAATQSEDSDCPQCRRPFPPGDTDPRRMGPFDVLGVIGVGPSSVVYEVRHCATGKRTALKRLLAGPGADEARNQAWLERAREDASVLHHPRIVRTHEPVHDRETGEVGVSMEWLWAGNCRKLAGPHLPLSTALLLGADLFDALAYLHALGLVHGGIKPENLLLSLSETQLVRGKLSDHGCHDPAPTPGFAAPELSLPDALPTPGTDLYAAAATLHFLLIGAPPPPQPTEPPTSLPAESRPSELARHRPDIPKELSDLLDSALRRDPSARTTAHAGEIALRLRRLAHA